MIMPQYWIKYFQREKFTETLPETKMVKILEEIKQPFIHPCAVDCIDDTGQRWTYTLDFRLLPSIDLECRGVVHDNSRTQVQKAAWRRQVLIYNNFRVIDFDCDLLTRERFHDYCKEKLLEAINSSEKYVRVFA